MLLLVSFPFLEKQVCLSTIEAMLWSMYANNHISADRNFVIVFLGTLIEQKYQFYGGRSL